jgi:hypothetical protein
MAKNLDGIKKLDPADIKKYRKIVLNYIGENDPAEEAGQPRNSNKIGAVSRKVDSINLNNLSRIGDKDKKTIKKSAGKEKVSLAVSAGQVSSSPAIKVGNEETDEEKEKKLDEAVKRQEEERKKIKEEERQVRLKNEQAEQERQQRVEAARQEKINQEKARIKQEKNNQTEAEKLVREQAEKERREKMEQARRERTKQEELKKQERDLAEKKRREKIGAIRQAELKKKEINLQAKREAEIKQQAEEAGKLAERIKLEEQEKAENMKIEEKSRLEKMQRQQERNRIKLEISLARQAAEEKKKIKRLKAWRRFKKNFKLKLREFSSAFKQNIIYIISFSVLCLATFYAVFCLAVLRFNAGNNVIIGQAIKYIPVPAVITSQGVISYNDYKKIERKNYLVLNLGERKNYLAKWDILHKLEQKYALVDSTVIDLATKFVLDKDSNSVGLSRIDKINEFLKGQDGIEQLGKYADDYNSGTYYSREDAAVKFGQAVLGLAIGQTSDILARADGYYIIQRIDDREGKIGVKYIFVAANTLEQYVSQKLATTKVFILVN